MSEQPSADAPQTEGAGTPLRPAAKPKTKPRVRPTPEQTKDDTDRGWGERPDEDAHDRWLQEQRPPHWE
ncbi:hypothetical protein ACTHQ1_00025 [Janibacter anophelis]|uniref:hypothetical protein n=1 Tax=Janibacter anophelis TaxID=319054 RepID=UPI0008341B1D|nr:hypothetical protein [Janibacter anophelis]